MARTLEEMLKDEFLQNRAKGKYDSLGYGDDEAAPIVIDHGQKHDMREKMKQVFLNLDKWAMTSPDQFRNCALGTSVKTAFVANPILGIKDEQATYVRDAVLHAVKAGRMIDFGNMPNTMIRELSSKGKEPFFANALVQPFEDWVMVSSWEGGYNGYYLCPNPDVPGEILITELYGVSIPNDMDLILFYDYCSVLPGSNPIQVRVADVLSKEGNTDDMIKSRSANCIDPMIAALMLLADASVPVKYLPAPEKLNKVRRKAGRIELPARYQVQTRDYVTRYEAHRAGGGSAGPGGTHASPITHWRRAHTRHMASGVVAQVRATQVNWRGEDEVHRLFYHVR